MDVPIPVKYHTLEGIRFIIYPQEMTARLTLASHSSQTM